MQSTAFNRLSEADKVAFLAENPDSWLNPYRQDRRRQHLYTDRPPAPPGTMAYAQWYWTHLMRSQPQHPHPGRAGQPSGYGAYGAVPPHLGGGHMGPPAMAQVPMQFQQPLPPLPKHG